MNFFENITFRKARTLSLTEISDEHSSNNLEIDGSASSLPNISNNENNEYVQELQNQIEQLTSQLNSAHEEIKNLNIENTELKKSLNVITNKNEVLKKATKKLTGEVQTPRKGSQTSTPRNHSQRKPAVIKKSTETLHSNTSGNSNNFGPGLQNTTAQKREGDGNNVTHKSAKHKLCIVSTNVNNKILSIAEDTFHNFQICHYVSPNCDTVQLISDIHKKLADYNYEDYCVIFIGEEDFQRTKDYVNIIVKLREALLKVQHTNIIICVPTFK